MESLLNTRKSWLIAFLGFSLFLLILAKIPNRYAALDAPEGEAECKQIHERISFLYEQGKCGRVTYQPNGKYRIAWHLPREKERMIPAAAPSGKAVTYKLSGGRLGDNLLSYLHARWIAYRDRVPLVRTPFPGDHEFALSSEIAQPGDYPLEVIPYFPEPTMKHPNPPFLVDWEDPGFREEIALCLKPTKPHNLLALPSDRITVCVHVRRGGTHDPQSLHLEYPLKFPPDSFYLGQIEHLTRIFRGQELYVFLMTDDLEPEKLLQSYQEALCDSNIQWDCREKLPENDLDDFYSIPQFDCLILPDSSFSIVASKLTEYAVRISPTHYKKKRDKVQITGLEIAFNPEYRK